jgi:YgiT-type zinc finger domain-containing protein
MDKLPCFECDDGNLENKIINYETVIDEQNFIVQNVPTLICNVCGDQLLSSKSCQIIDTAIDEAFPNRIKRSPRRIKN